MVTYRVVVVVLIAGMLHRTNQHGLCVFITELLDYFLSAAALAEEPNKNRKNISTLDLMAGEGTNHVEHASQKIEGITAIIVHLHFYLP